MATLVLVRRVKDDFLVMLANEDQRLAVLKSKPHDFLEVSKVADLHLFSMPSCRYHRVCALSKRSAAF